MGVVRVNHWGRTFVPGGGTVIIPLPLSPAKGYSRFPKKYITYDFAQFAVMFMPVDPNIRVRDNMVEVLPHTRTAGNKIGFDTDEGWMGYLSKENLLFVKQFPAPPKATYGEMLGLTCCVFYWQDRLVELEPIGPLEELQPGQTASFTETWAIHDFQTDEGGAVDLAAVAAAAAAIAPP